MGIPFCIEINMPKTSSKKLRITDKALANSQVKGSAEAKAIRQKNAAKKQKAINAKRSRKNKSLNAKRNLINGWRQTKPKKLVKPKSFQRCSCCEKRPSGEKVAQSSPLCAIPPPTHIASWQ